MAEGLVKIDYWTLGLASKDAGTLSRRINDYKDEIQKKVIDKLSSLSGADSCGYASDASASAVAKTSELDNLKSQVDHFKTSLDNFITDAKDADKRVASDIKCTGDQYVGKRTWYQKVGDWMYDTFCVDFAGSNTVTKLLADCAGWVRSRVAGPMEDLYHWFKNKDGKYVWNIVKKVGAIVGAVVGAIGAIAGIVLSAPIAVVIVTIAAAVAAVVLLVTEVVNSGTGIVENVKAIGEARNGNIGIARYHGNTESYSDHVRKTDYGSGKSNKRHETTGKVIDYAETGATIVSLVTGIVSMGGHINKKTGKMDRISWKDFKDNVRKTFGFKRRRYILDESTGKKTYWSDLKNPDGTLQKASEKPKSGYKVDWHREKGESLDVKKLLGIGQTDTVFFGIKPSKATYRHKMQKLPKGLRRLKNTLDVDLVITRGMGLLENIDDLRHSPDTKKDGWKKAKEVNNLLSFWKPISYTKKIFDGGDLFLKLAGD